MMIVPLLVAAVFLLLPIIYVIAIYNALVALRNHIRDAWANIDTELKRRYDLIPNLVATVKGYAAHEKEIFESVANARSRLLSAQGPAAKAEASGAMTSALGRLLAIAENYPALKADTTFARLQDELAGTENRITVARKRYNDVARAYNTAIRKFPGSLFAGSMERKKAEYYEPPESREKLDKPPEVTF